MTESASSGARYSRAEGAVLKRVGGAGAVYLPANGSLHVLNRTGEAIVRALEEPASIEELAVALAAASGSPVDAVARDVAAFLPQLVELGVLVEA
jgi:PqqD family protein of HPr-rel-A system